MNVELDWIERVLGRSHNTKNIDEKEEWNYSELDELNKILQCNELSTYITTADRILNNAIELVTEDTELIDTKIDWLESDNADSFQVWNTTRILDHEFKELNKEWNILEEKENDWTKEYEGDGDSIELLTIEL